MIRTPPPHGTQEEAWIWRQLEIIRGELASASAERHVQRDVVNALFGLELKTPLPEQVLLDTGVPRSTEANKTLREGVPRLSQECHEAAQQLAKKLDE